MKNYSVCLSFDVNYLPYAQVLLDSISKGLSHDVYCQISVLTGCKELLLYPKDFFSNYTNLDVNFIDVSEQLVNFKPVGRFPSQVYARFFMHKYLTGEVLYLDVDVIVRCCISEVFKSSNLDLGFSACIDTGIAMKRSFGHTSSKYTSYFNAGVFVCDLNNRQVHYTFDKAIKLAQSNEYPLADQDALNHALEGKFSILNLQYNYTGVISPEKYKIIHFAHIKPNKMLKYFRAFHIYSEYVDTLSISFPYSQYDFFTICKKLCYVFLANLIYKIKYYEN